MKILYYNWVDYLDDEKRGGGVSLYQRNLMQHLTNNEDVDCTFLSSGISYDLRPRAPRWVPMRHGPKEDRERRFEIVNSAVIAPSHHSFGHEAQIRDAATVEAFHDFMTATGPYDIVHFNNLEGIPAEVLELSSRWPETKFVLSLHNYYPFCPQVNLWHKEAEHCENFAGGAKCDGCLPFQADHRIVRLADAVAFALKKRGVRPGTKAFDRGFGPAMRVAGKTARILRGRSLSDESEPKVTGPVAAAKYRQRRADMVRLINENCKAVLCVSKRVQEIAARYGVEEALLSTCYIGSRHAEKYKSTIAKPHLLRADFTLRLAYLGYMRLDKGFYFFLDGLEAVPDSQASRMHVLIAAQARDGAAIERIRALENRFASVTFQDGYAHDEMDALLDDVDLGVVPVLWEDNLPQVAIEMHARHVPLLTSDRGGAQELGRFPDLVFKAGNVESFLKRIDEILGGAVDLDAYWSGAMAPVSLEEHERALLAQYRAC